MDSVAVIMPYVMVNKAIWDTNVIIDSTRTQKVKEMLFGQLMESGEKKLKLYSYAIDSKELLFFHKEVSEMIKIFQVQHECDHGNTDLVKDTSYLKNYKFSDSICNKLKKTNARYCLSSYYTYVYNDKDWQLFQESKHHIGSGSHTGGYGGFIGRKYNSYFFVLDLETGYPVYYNCYSDVSAISSTPSKFYTVGILKFLMHEFYGRIRKGGCFNK
jgi:hypothetical protein